MTNSHHRAMWNLRLTLLWNSKFKLQVSTSQEEIDYIQLIIIFCKYLLYLYEKIQRTEFYMWEWLI